MKMKNIKIDEQRMFVPGTMVPEVAPKSFKNQYISYEGCKEDMIKAHEDIINGNVYAEIASVSKSGMSRRIKFFAPRIDKDGKPYISRITAEIAWLTGWVNIGEFKQGGKYLSDYGLKVNGCGMDMIFHTLYVCLPYEDAGKNWSQRYNRL